MNYSREILDKVKYCGILQYEPERVIRTVNPEDPEAFSFDLNDPESVVSYVYQQGLNQGKFSLDAALYKLQAAEAELQTMAVKREKEVDKMIADYLGESIDEINE